MRREYPGAWPLMLRFRRSVALSLDRVTAGGQTGAIPAPLDAHAESVPAVGGPGRPDGGRGTRLRHQRSWRRHPGRRPRIRAHRPAPSVALRDHRRRCPVTPIASSTHAPFEALVVHRLSNGDGNEAPAILSRRRTRRRRHARTTSSCGPRAPARSRPASRSACRRRLRPHLRRQGRARPVLRRRSAPSTAGSTSSPRAGNGPRRCAGIGRRSASTAIRSRGRSPPRRTDGTSLVLTALPVVDGEPILSIDGDDPVANAVAIRDVGGWWHGRPSVTSTDARIVVAVEQALIDLAALQIRDVAHPERVLVAAGAPWFMTLFGRDSLLTARMSLPFDASLAPGVLLTLAELRGRRVRPGRRGGTGQDPP